jgi:hypothetical protein
MLTGRSGRGLDPAAHQSVAELLGDLAAHFHDRGRGGVDIGTDQITPFFGIELRRDASTPGLGSVGVSCTGQSNHL